MVPSLLKALEITVPELADVLSVPEPIAAPLLLHPDRMTVRQLLNLSWYAERTRHFTTDARRIREAIEQDLVDCGDATLAALIRRHPTLSPVVISRGLVVVLARCVDTDIATLVAAQAVASWADTYLAEPDPAAAMQVIIDRTRFGGRIATLLLAVITQVSATRALKTAAA